MLIMLMLLKYIVYIIILQYVSPILIILLLSLLALILFINTNPFLITFLHAVLVGNNSLAFSCKNDVISLLLLLLIVH